MWTLSTLPSSSRLEGIRGRGARDFDKK